MPHEDADADGGRAEKGCGDGELERDGATPDA
jgi:hypothetical protein